MRELRKLNISRIGFIFSILYYGPFIEVLKISVSRINFREINRNLQIHELRKFKRHACYL